MKRIAVAAVVACSVALAGCGGDDSGVSTSGSDEDQIRAVATAYYEAYAAKDFGKVCDLMGPSARAQLTLAAAFVDEKSKDCAEIAAAVSAASDGEPQLSLGEIRVDGDLAIAVDGVDNGSGPSDMGFERVDGRWLVAAEPGDGEEVQAKESGTPSREADDEAGGQPQSTVIETIAEGLGTDLGVAPAFAAMSGEPPTKLVIDDVVEGKGRKAELGDTIEVRYALKVWGGEVADSSWTRDPNSTTFPLVEGGLVEGWIAGIPGMKEGGRRLLIVPPEQGYGDEAQGSRVPAGSTLVFAVDLVKVSPGD